MKHEFRERAARCQNRAELFFDSKKGFSRHRNFPASPRTQNPPLQRNSKFFWTFLVRGFLKKRTFGRPSRKLSHLAKNNIRNSHEMVKWSWLKAGQELTRGALQLNLRLEAHHERAPNSYRRKLATWIGLNEESWLWLWSFRAKGHQKFRPEPNHDLCPRQETSSSQFMPLFVERSVLLRS